MDRNRDVARKVYDTPEGRVLLTDLLNDLKFFAMLETTEDIAVHNQAIGLLEKLGIWREHNIIKIVNALMNMSYTEGEQDG